MSGISGIAKAIVDLIIGVFTEIAPAFGSALVDTAESLFWVAGEGAAAGSLTTLATVCLTFAAISIGASLLYKIFSLIRFKRNANA